MKTATLCILFVAACGSGDGTADLAASQDGGFDAGQPDVGAFECGSAGVCPASDVCCVETPDGGAIPSCVATCTGGFPVSCAGPQYCGGNPCCLALQSNNAQSVSCSAAATDCAPNVMLGGNGVTRVCNTDDDCTAGAPNTQFNQCCHLVTSGYRICFSSFYVGLSKGAIACP